MILALGISLIVISLAFGLADNFDLWPNAVWSFVYRHNEGLYEFFGVGFLLGIVLTLGSLVAGWVS